jgi:hypothetical protein
MEDDAARDPMEVKTEEVSAVMAREDDEEDPIPVSSSKQPVTVNDIASVGEPEKAAS